MKKFFIIFLLLLFSSVCSADVALSSATRTKSVNATVGLSSAARHGGGGWADDAWADYWTFDGATEWLTASDSIKLKPESLTGDFTVLAGFKSAGTGNQGIVSKGDNATSKNEYFIYTDVFSKLKLKYSNTGSVYEGCEVSSFSYANKKTIAKLTLDNDGSYYQVHGSGIYDGGSVLSRDNPNRDIGVYDGGETFYIGDHLGLDELFTGNFYFVAIYHSIVSDVNMAAILAGTVHPANLSPVFYIDFSKDVDATYSSEIGNVTITVHGTPTKGP